jgi:hypothetical protein
MRWSIIAMWQPCVTMTICPDLIIIGERVPALGHTWFMAMVPIKIDHPCVVAKAEDFLLGAVNLEFTVCLDQCSTPKVKGAQAVFNNIGLKHRTSLAEKRLSQTFAVCQIGGGKSLESFSVTDGDEIWFSDIRDDGNIRREIEVDGKRDKFVKRLKIFCFNKWYMKNKDTVCSSGQ